MNVRQLTVVSGKGGTGKTTVVAAFATLARGVVLADCDVDAADLHLVLDPEIHETIPFAGPELAEVEAAKCTQCGICTTHCKFEAIVDGVVNEPRCEGCAVCELVCPTDAIRMVDRRAGEAYVAGSRFGPLVYARLAAAAEGTGLLVSLVRERARATALETGRDMVIVDGPPGIGCPVIASLTGVDLTLIVTEPTLSGIGDMARIADVAAHFNVPALVCINKWDLSPANTERIEAICAERGLPVVGRLPYDTAATSAMLAGRTVTESESALADALRALWERVAEWLSGDGDGVPQYV